MTTDSLEMIQHALVPPLDAVPFEILVKINQYLSNQDRYQLCLVNRSLSDFFKSYIFHYLTFHSEEQVINSCGRLTEEPTLFWKITTLSINVPFSRKHPYSNFISYCRNLEVFIIGKRFWEPLDDNVDGGIHADGGVDDMAVDLDSYPEIPTLLELDIDCRRIYGIEDLFVLFTKCPRVKRLTLRQPLLKVTPNDMEQVHAICSDLESLTLDHTNTPRSLIPFGVVLQPRLQPLATTCLTMKHLSVFHNGLWDEFIPWIYYIADKYPRLKSLNISLLPTWWNNHGQTDTLRVDSLEKAVHVLVDSCRQLDSVRFENVWWATSFFRYRLNRYYPQQQDATLRQVSVATDLVGAKIATSTFNLISVAVLPYVSSLDLALHTDGMATPPLDMFQCFREARVLTDLRLSTPGNRMTTTCLIWFLAFCPVLRSLVLDNGSIDAHLDDHRWMAKRKRRTASSTHQLVSLTLTNCVFANDIFGYLEKTCPDLRQITLTTCLLHRSPSLRLWFPNHIFRSILINHVRVASAAPTLAPSTSAPITTVDIGNPATWMGEQRQVEFITIRRHHARGTAPTYRLSPCYIPNQHISPTRSMQHQLFASGGPYKQKMQTFKVTSMTSRNQQVDNKNRTGFGAKNNYNRTAVMGVVSFLPLEFINTTKCMNARELDYYEKMGGLFLPHDAGEHSSSSLTTSGSKQYTRTTAEINKRQRLQERVLTNQSQGQLRYQQGVIAPANHMGLSSSLQQQQQQQQQQQLPQRSTDITIGSHLLVNVYGITELQVNGKWMVF